MRTGDGSKAKHTTTNHNPEYWIHSSGNSVYDIGERERDESN